MQRILLNLIVPLAFWAAPSVADDLNVMSTEPHGCPATAFNASGHPNYWIDCVADPCPEKSILVGGTCDAGDTRGFGIAVESFGIRDNRFYCRYVDARNIGTGTTLQDFLKVSASASCLTIGQ